MSVFFNIWIGGSAINMCQIIYYFLGVPEDYGIEDYDELVIIKLVPFKLMRIFSINAYRGSNVEVFWID